MTTAGDGIQRARTGAVELAYETFGDRSDPPLLLIMGLATQMLAWPDRFCAGLADRGLFVVRFDNRDVGLSTHLDDAPPADVGAALGGDASSASYTLSDMAADTAGLIEALGLRSAHLAGVSMGGMIAQTLAIEHPERVRSLTSIMSTTGDRSVGGATEAAVAVLMAPAATTREEAQELSLQTYRVIGSPAYPLDEAAIRQRAATAFDRGHDPAGVARQFVGIQASPDRTPALAELRIPALVIHGAQDPLIDVSGGRATAAAIPGAELVVLEGMGHDLPEALWAEIGDRIAGLVARAEALDRAGHPW
jgi:pimeloyl-ACP methyl ester carboxylesterase